MAPAHNRTRYPPLFHNVPTDAEYAMELISQRVARGLDVKPKKRRTKSGTPSQESDRFSFRTSAGDARSMRSFGSSESSSSGKWQKFANHVDTSKNIAKDAKKLLKDGQASIFVCWAFAVRLMPGHLLSGSGPGTGWLRIRCLPKLLCVVHQNSVCRRTVGWLCTI